MNSVLSSASGAQSSVATAQRIGKYVPADPVAIIARSEGCPRSVAAQKLKLADPRNYFAGAARLAAALIAGGRADVAERLCLPIDIVRAHVKAKLTDDLMADCQQQDLLEDLAENEARSFPSIESKRRWLKALKADHAKQAEEIAALEAECAE